MARKANQDDLRKLVQGINKSPGKQVGFWASMFGWRREKVIRNLTTLNDQKRFFYEDDAGGLYPFPDKLESKRK